MSIVSAHCIGIESYSCVYNMNNLRNVTCMCEDIDIAVWLFRSDVARLALDTSKIEYARLNTLSEDCIFMQDVFHGGSLYCPQAPAGPAQIAR